MTLEEKIRLFRRQLRKAKAELRLAKVAAGDFSFNQQNRERHAAFDQVGMKKLLQFIHDAQDLLVKLVGPEMIKTYEEWDRADAGLGVAEDVVLNYGIRRGR